MLKHRHQFEGPRKVESGFTSMIKELIVKKLETSGSKSNMPSVNVSRRGSDINLGALENGEGKRLVHRRPIAPDGAQRPSEPGPGQQR